MFRSTILLSQQYNIIFQGQYLSYEELITNNEIMVIIDHTCKKVSTSNIVGFIGSTYSSEARYFASFAHRLGILCISYSATSRDLSTIANKAFYRIVPSDENTPLSIAILFQQYHWKSCIILYQNDEYGYNGMNLKTTLLNSLSRIMIVWADEKTTITNIK